MAYNLIDERWIPVVRRTDKREMISPSEIADRADPPLRVQSPRPDFDGALLEFLIGLLQAASAPKTEAVWEQEFGQPPAVEALQARFLTVRDAFFLDGEGPRFMQDLTVFADTDAKQQPIGALLVDRIGESGLEESPSLFAKPDLFPALGYPATAAALMALQTYSPSGGRGQLTSLRGGGPLTTLVLGHDLWSTLWLNVLPRDEADRRLPGDRERTDRLFPWMQPTRSSEGRAGLQTPPQEVHPLQHYWGLPRRFRIDFGAAPQGACSVFGADGPVAVSFRSRPDGTSYDGDYRHPLSPYRRNKPGEPWSAKKGPSDGLPYKDWPALVTGTEDRSPAAVVQHFVGSHRRELVDQPRLLAFGYAMSNMKPLQWCQSSTPLIAVAPALAERFAALTRQAVDASEEARTSLSYQIKAAWTNRPQDLDAYTRVNPVFWAMTEAAFFRCLAELKAGVEAEDGAREAQAKEIWLVALSRASLSIFDSFVGAAAEQATSDLRRAVIARRDLTRFVSPRAKKLRDALGLAVEAPLQKRRRKSKEIT